MRLGELCVMADEADFRGFKQKRNPRESASSAESAVYRFYNARRRAIVSLTTAASAGR
jgi:hypothetical protein